MPLTPPTARQSRVIWTALTGLALATIVALIVAAFWGLAKIVNLLSPVLWPLAIAAVVACLLSPVVDYFESRKISRRLAIVLVFVLAFTVVSSVLASVIPQVMNETSQLAKKVPEYSQRLQADVNQILTHTPEFLRRFLPQRPVTAVTPATPTAATTPATPMIPVVPAASGTNEPAANPATPQAPTAGFITAWLPDVGNWLLQHALKVASSLGLLAGLALVPIYAFHFLIEQRRIATHWREYVPLRESSAKHEIIFLLEAIGQYLVAFFRGQVLVALCVSVLYTIGFLAIGLNYAFLIGFMAVFLTMVPFLGAAIVCLTAILLACVQYGNWQHPALVLAVFALVQSLESFIISPKIMGDRMSLHPLIIIIAVMAGTTVLGGILGGLVAIPLAAALRVILARYVWSRL
jgi:predicted PurR-regulated permease PerM